MPFGENNHKSSSLLYNEDSEKPLSSKQENTLNTQGALSDKSSYVVEEDKQNKYVTLENQEQAVNTSYQETETKKELLEENESLLLQNCLKNINKKFTNISFDVNSLIVNFENLKKEISDLDKDTHKSFKKLSDDILRTSDKYYALEENLNTLDFCLYTVDSSNSEKNKIIDQVNVNISSLQNQVQELKKDIKTIHEFINKHHIIEIKRLEQVKLMNNTESILTNRMRKFEDETSQQLLMQQVGLLELRKEFKNEIQDFKDTIDRQMQVFDEKLLLISNQCVNTCNTHQKNIAQYLKSSLDNLKASCQQKIFYLSDMIESLYEKSIFQDSEHVLDKQNLLIENSQQKELDQDISSEIENVYNNSKTVLKHELPKISTQGELQIQSETKKHIQNQEIRTENTKDANFRYKLLNSVYLFNKLQVIKNYINFAKVKNFIKTIFVQLLFNTIKNLLDTAIVAPQVIFHVVKNYIGSIKIKNLVKTVIRVAFVSSLSITISYVCYINFYQLV